MGIRYDSEESVDFAEQLSHFIQKYAHGTSQQLAEIRGAFPNWKGSIWDAKHHQPMRNAAVTTIAPTGSISIIADCNGGIEPIYSLVSKRRALEGQEFIRLICPVNQLYPPNRKKLLRSKSLFYKVQQR